jgi:hypothetical protein
LYQVLSEDGVQVKPEMVCPEESEKSGYESSYTLPGLKIIVAVGKKREITSFLFFPGFEWKCPLAARRKSTGGR